MVPEIIYGTVAAVIYQNPENGYTVLRLNSQDGDVVTVVGTVPMVAVGERLSVTGRWTSHSSYGRQFEAELLDRLMPENSYEILAYLSSGIVKGVGEKTAKKIVAAFGERSLDIMENDPASLSQIQGISLSKAKEISENFRRQVGMRRLLEFLSEHQLPGYLAMRLYRAYGEMAVDALMDDPYMLTENYFGAPFSAVDGFAIEIGIEADDERRVEAGIIFEIVYNQRNGHVFIPRDKLAEATAIFLSLERDIIDEGISRLLQSGRLEKDIVAGLEACYLPEYREAEVYIAQRIIAMQEKDFPPPSNLEKLLKQVQAETEVVYASNQMEAIRAAARERIVLITGGPGTGKTTTMAGILDLFDKMGLSTQLSAPTGRAAKRLCECTGRDAQTIHRLLEAQFDPESGSMTFCRDEHNQLEIDALVIDEMSMVDVLLMKSILLAIPEQCRLVLVGDPDQLPSVGPGFVFSDLLRSEIIPTVRLTEIFRQAGESLIVMNAHAVNHGHMPDLGNKKKDFFFMKRTDADAVVQTIQELCFRRLPENMGIRPEDIQVLSPTKKGETGTINLNRRLQAVLNPPQNGKKEKKYGEFLFRVGDRVMQIRNNYDILWKKCDGSETGAGVFNGDIGIVADIDYPGERIVVLFDEKEAVYDFSLLSELELAYAMTVHKSQGSEFPAVIMTSWPGPAKLLTRNVLYTALTRAKDLLVLVGNEAVTYAMVENDCQQKRFSGLKLRLQKRVCE